MLVAGFFVKKSKMPDRFKPWPGLFDRVFFLSISFAFQCGFGIASFERTVRLGVDIISY